MLDLRTLFFIAMVAIACVCILTVVAWLQNRSERTLMFWAIGYGLFAIGLGIISGREALPWVVGYALANGIIAGAYGCIWVGVRVFDDRPIPWFAIFGGPILCFAAYMTPAIMDDYRVRTVIITGLAALYSFAIVFDLWRGRGDGLKARVALGAAVAINGVANLARALHSLSLPADHVMLTTPSSIDSVVSLISLLAVISANLMLMAMSKERAAAEMRRLAEVDPLTGAMTRGRFRAVVEAMASSSHASRVPLTTVMFDLDEFKAINDEAGHAAGDLLLCRFAETVRGAMPSGATFGRIGGDEFAVALPAGEDAAARFAESVRVAYAEAAADSALPGSTVSAGIAALILGHDIECLLGRADRALYAAKAGGRDRVERDWELSC